MTFHCDSCGMERDFDTEYGMCVAYEKKLMRICRLCRRPRAGLPDVFWDGPKPEENLADDPRTGEPRVFFSRGEKAAYLKERGLMEAGDRTHGSLAQLSQNQNRKTDSHHEVKMALKKVREMGRDNRHQEYLRIIKQGRDHAKG